MDRVIIKARFVLPELEKYRRFDGMKESLKNGQIVHGGGDDVSARE